MLFIGLPASSTTKFNVVYLSSPLDTGELEPGNIFTIGIRMTTTVPINQLAASVFGYDEDVIDFVSGFSVRSIYNDYIYPEYNYASGGLFNRYFEGDEEIHESSIGASGNRAQIFWGWDPLKSHVSNPLDPGILEFVGGPQILGGAQILVNFRVVGAGQSIIDIGTGYIGDGETYAGGVTDQSANTRLFVNAVPEPGIAILIGLGLAGLTYRRRQE